MPDKSVLRSVVAFVLVAVLTASLSFGQTRRHDLSLSYGLGTIDQIADIIEDVLLITITLGTFAKTDMQPGGAPFLTYHYSRNSRFGFGFALGGYRTEGTLLNNITDEEVGPYTETNYIGALEIDYRWVMKKGFQLYSGAGVGIRLRQGEYTSGLETDTRSQTLPTFHVNLLGLRVGGKVGFFAEAGFGYKGIVCGGLNAQF